MKFLMVFFIFKVTKAIIYPSSAIVTDERVLKAKIGVNSYEIILNPFVDENSIKIDVEGGKLISVDTKREKFEKPVEPLKSLQDSLEKLKRLQNIYNNEKEQIKNAIEFLKSFRVAYSEKVGKEYLEKPFEYRKLSETIDYLLEKGEELGRKIIDVEKKINEINKKIDIVSRKINELKPVGEEGVKLKIDLKANSTNLKLTLEYLVKARVGWYPFYEVHALPDEEKCEITGWAKVYQFTGENWNNVKITLSTGTPHLRLKPPDIIAWNIILREIPFLVKEKATEREPAIPGMTGMPYAPPPPPEEKFLTLHYEIPGFTDIPSRKEPVPLLYQKTKLKSKFEHYTYPRLDQKVYFKGKILNISENLFVGGEANLYIEKEYRGKGYLNILPPNDSTELSFGEDPEIKVKREKKVHEVYKKGLVKKSVVHHLEYETSLKNLRKRNVKVILVEQVPVSTNPDVKIGNIKFSEKPFEVKEAEGVYKFKIDLNPNQEFKLKFSFDVVSAKEDIRIGGF